ncbi:MAG: 50S ribosomal protein L5, partial [Acidobacteria bacterium]|nr:50S ribosomal protein L5 [Acidobacteriota bacterium]
MSKEKKGAEGAEGAKAAAEKPAKAPRAEPSGAEKGQKPQKSQKTEKGQKGQKAPKGAEGAGRKGAEGAGAEQKSKAKPVADPPGYKPRLKKLYLETVAKDLKEEFGYSSPMQVPRLSKIVVSMGIGEAIANKKLLDAATQELTQITGRKAMRTQAKKSIATFKLRKGMDIGAVVTLRGKAMYEFLDRLVNAAMPRIKDFRGANPNAFDGHGNYSLGVTEQIIFPEIDYDKIERVSGMNIAVVTTAATDAEGRS